MTPHLGEAIHLFWALMRLDSSWCGIIAGYVPYMYEEVFWAGHAVSHLRQGLPGKVHLRPSPQDLQAWPLSGLVTNSIFQGFLIHWFAWMANKLPPHCGRLWALMFLPATPSSLSQTIEGLFELICCPSRVLTSPWALLLELQRHRYWIR